jgi:outer membrane receptor protein involved in Fe transport
LFLQSSCQQFIGIFHLVKSGPAGQEWATMHPRILWIQFSAGSTYRWVWFFYFSNIYRCKCLSGGAFIGNSDLKPEMTSEYELGVDLRFLNNRIAFDLAYYDKKIDDLIWASPIASTSGNLFQMQNLGTMQNYGFEVLVKVVPVQKARFEWEMTFNYTRNFNKLVSLNNKLEKAELNALRIDGGQQIQWVAIPGEPVGVFEARGPRYSPQGKLLVNNQGLPIANTELRPYGTSQYDYFGGLRIPLLFLDSL